MRVFTHQIRVVAANFRMRPFWMREEIQIMNRDHLRGVARWQEQRVRGVRDVEIEAGQLLDLRPAKAVPREVEQANRDPPVDGARAAKLGGGREAILPGTGKDRQGERAVGPRRPARRRIRREQRLYELMRVLAGAAPIAQRRAIVDQDAHLFKSFRLSILL